MRIGIEPVWLRLPGMFSSLTTIGHFTSRLHNGSGSCSESCARYMSNSTSLRPSCAGSQGGSIAMDTTTSGHVFTRKCAVESHTRLWFACLSSRPRSNHYSAHESRIDVGTCSRSPVHWVSEGSSGRLCGTTQLVQCVQFLLLPSVELGLCTIKRAALDGRVFSLLARVELGFTSQPTSTHDTGILIYVRAVGHS